MKRKIFIHTFFLAITFSHAQLSNEILGTWIKTKVENLEKGVTPEINRRNTFFTKYTFENKNNLFVSLDPNEKGNLVKYKIEGSILNIGFIKFEIEKIEDNQLVLVELINNRKNENSIRTYYLKEGYFLNQLPIDKDDILTNNGASLYFESERVYPKFKNKDNADVKDFIQPFVEGKSHNENTFANASFIIDIDGSISEVQIFHHINKKFDEALEKAIKRTKGMWISPIVNGKKVRVMKSISFNYIEYPDIKWKGDSLSIKKKNNFSDSFKDRFKHAVKLFLKDDFEKSLNLLNEMGAVESTNFSITSLQRNIYKKTGDTTNFDLATKKLEQSKFSYLLK
ncbi:MAG: hypothetical protein ABJN84_13635 [Flavobacteriaceae bacterium]